jgi:hypothetical protein
MRHWWTLPKTVAWLALKKSREILQDAVDDLKEWLNGR